MDNAIRNSQDESLAYVTKEPSSNSEDFSSSLALDSGSSQKEQDDSKNGHNYNGNTIASEEAKKVSKSKEELLTKKRKNALMDDFFVIGDLEPKKKTKKTKRTKTQSTDRKLEDTDFSGKESHSKEENEVLMLEKIGSEGKDTSPDDQEIFKKTEKPPERSVTPPPAFDKETIIKEKLKKKSRSGNKKELEFSDEEDELEIELLRGSTQITNLFTKGSQRSEEGQNVFSDQNERNRMYRIQLVSKLNPASDSCAEFRTNGTKKFSGLLKRIMANFRNICKFSGTDASIYEESEAALVWIDEKMELKPFYKPSTLRIPPPDKKGLQETWLYCLLIPKLNLKNFTSIYPEFRPQSSGSSSSFQADPVSLDVDSILDSTDKDEYSSSREPQIQPRECGNNEYFIIGLKGKDNKRIEVQVSPTTPIHKLLHYYLEIKGINKSELDYDSAKLIFDDEKLDLNGRVGDTELEEDFEVQVML